MWPKVVSNHILVGLCNSLINWFRRTRFIRTPRRHAIVSALLKQAARMKRQGHMFLSM